MLKPEQVEKIKSQLIGQIEKSFPADKKGFAINQIESMDSEQLENFLKQNKLIKNKEETHGSSQCVFCSIASGQIQNFKIGENKDAIAVLEINPISRGHVLIVPKEHIVSADKLKKSIFGLAKDITKRIKTKLEPKNIVISSTNLMGHEIVNLIPVYDSEDSSSERQKASHQELSDLQKVLEKKHKSVVKRIKKEKTNPHAVSEKKRWLPKRIP